MNFLETVTAKAVENPSRVVLCEVGDVRILQAARVASDRGIAHPILLGDPALISSTAALAGVDTLGIAIVDATDPDLAEAVAVEYRLASERLSDKAIRRKMRNPLEYACALVVTGRADAVAAGVAHSTGEVVLAAETMFGPAPGVGTVSSMGFLEVPGWEGAEGNLLGIADCAVCPNPTADELVDIAISSARTACDLLGWEPRVAMLSYSTDGSGEGETVDKVRAAVALARERFPELEIDGELQLDAAIVPSVAARKVTRESTVAGRANIVVFPDLNAGNIGVKLVQIFARANVPGPMLQGFAHPITDFSRSAPLDEIVGNVAMLSVRAAAQSSGRRA